MLQPRGGIYTTCSLPSPCTAHLFRALPLAAPYCSSCCKFQHHVCCEPDHQVNRGGSNVIDLPDCYRKARREDQRCEKGSRDHRMYYHCGSRTPPQRNNNSTFTNGGIIQKDTLTAQGVETQPGPKSQRRRKYLETIFFAFPPGNTSIDISKYPQCHLIESQNCASLNAHFDEAVNRQVHCRFYQETCVDEKLLRQTEETFEAKGWSATVGRPNNEGSKPTAGVAITVKRDGAVTKIEAITDDYKAAVKTGRIEICICNFETEHAFYGINIYGWTNGHTCKEAALKPSSLVKAATNELQHHPALPRLLMGDVNANGTDINAIMNC